MEERSRVALLEAEVGKFALWPHPSIALNNLLNAALYTLLTTPYHHIDELAIQHQYSLV